MTLEDIAREKGVAKSTVSLALRGSTKVKPETTERIREAANRLGYRPDPILSAFSVRGRQGRAASLHPNVAVIWPDRKNAELIGASWNPSPGS